MEHVDRLDERDLFKERRDAECVEEEEDREESFRERSASDTGSS